MRSNRPPKTAQALTASIRVSLRLPLPLAAQLAALCELHPVRSRTQILTDLLSVALSQVALVAPASAGHEVVAPHAGSPIYLLSGPFPEFHHLVVKHHRRLERELAGDDAEAPAVPDGYNLNVDT